MVDSNSPLSDIPGVVLAGGRSQRMGIDKALVRLGGLSLLDRAIDRFSPQISSVALNADSNGSQTHYLPLVPDTIPGKAGPLAGVLAAMRYTAENHGNATHVATVPVDTPFFPLNLISRLITGIGPGNTIAIAASNGRRHPVFGLWPVAIADDLQDWLNRNETRRVLDFLRRHDVQDVDFPMTVTRVGLLDPFFNINTPDDLAQAERWLEVLGS
ncbi:MULTISPECIES: molybdenum cofactor guanylyltransferase MobA [unclassified Sinorhizobium]|uniref:molybdenum cofactor guanylyltransferase MobA n=1 Tax=unclassified Sinorhizobium TaxID=2613772 RepID=UPI0035240846